MKILKVLMMKMSVNFMLNEHVISNQRTLVFIMHAEEEIKQNQTA